MRHDVVVNLTLPAPIRRRLADVAADLGVPLSWAAAAFVAALEEMPADGAYYRTPSHRPSPRHGTTAGHRAYA
jgi:hypothetical protein